MALRPSTPAVGLAGLLLLVACGEEAPRGQERPPVVVEVVEAEARSLPEVVAAVGSLESPDPTTLAAQIEGDLVSLRLPEGELVEEGRVLARIDDRQARAAVQVAEARWRNARQRLERVRALREKGVASQETLDDAVAEFESAAGQLAEARTRLHETAIRAPFRGVLGLRRVGLGDYVRPGDPVVEITPDTGLELSFAVPQRHASRIAVGQRVHGQVGPCGPRFEGRVTAVDPRIDPRSRTLAVEALVQDGPGEEADPAARARRDGRLAPGMGVRLRVLVGEQPEAIVIPREAVVRQGTRTLVYVLDEQDVARRRAVELGEYFPDGVHVRAGLSPGDRVVASGHQKLRPGAATRPRPWEPTRNPNLDLGRFGPVGECGAPGP